MLDTFKSRLGDKESDSIHSSSALAGLINGQSTDVDFHASLTIIGQALTPYIVGNVLSDIQSHFDTGTLAFHHLHQQLGDDVVVARGNLIKDNKSELKAMLTALSATFNIDIGLQLSQPSLSKGGLLVMDMDSTVIGIECIDEIAKLADVGREVAEVTEKAMRGEIAFNESLNHRVACLEGVPVEHLRKIRDSLPIMPGIQALLSELKKHGWKLAIASGGFTYFADHLKQRLELDFATSNTLEVDNGQLTGKVVGEIVNADVKAETVKQLAAKWNIDSEQTVAMGDGANDLVMMKEAALGVACHGKPVVNEKADVAIRTGSLHSLLYFLSE
ncbi:phosphoserine phosphatase SerB [Alteromonas hispanica]|uniref:phosphoserine phosphatase SerB n=1 Tax=Alteromonas hispanica TaxID=315421 RepID=UPI003083FD1C